MRKSMFTLWIAAMGLSLLSCEDWIPKGPADDELLDGPVSGLTYEQNRQFIRGDKAFNDEIFTAETGLGPLFVASSCGSCHAGDGKGHPFTTLTRFGQVDASGNQFLNMGGPQLQHRALPGFLPEQLPIGVASAQFIPPGNTGLGLLELVSDADILEMADPDDENADGVSGVPNWIKLPGYANLHENAIPNNGMYIGRFGKKASVYNLLHQTVNAYNQDIGITTSFEPYDTYSGFEIDPEIPMQTVHDVVFYLQTLKAPIQRNQDNPQVIAGKNLFLQIGCGNCHRETLKSGSSPIEALSNQTFHPYTDLLLHDMGPELDDGYTEGSAPAASWRTPALWGLGLSPKAQGGSYFLMHDGRAKSITEAMQLHGGEGEISRTNFNQLSVEDKSAIIKFLQSL